MENADCIRKKIMALAMMGLLILHLFSGSIGGKMVVAEEAETPPQSSIQDVTPPQVVLICEDEDYKSTEAILCKITVTDDSFDVNGVNVFVTKVLPSGVVENEKVETVTFENGVEKELSFNEEGVYTIYAEVSDQAGNKTTTDKIEFIIDATAPELTVDAGEKLTGKVYSTKTNPVVLNIKASDQNLVLDSCKMKVEKDGEVLEGLEGVWCGDSDKTVTITFDDEFEDGEYIVQATAQDIMGQSSCAEFSFQIDNTAVVVEDLKVVYDNPDGGVPNQLIENGVTTYCFRDSAKVMAKVVENNYEGAKVYVKTTRDGTIIEENTIDMRAEEERVSLTYSEEGSYVTAICGEDEFGNKGEVTLIHYVIDKSEPVISNITYSNTHGVLKERYHNIYSDQAILVEFTVEDKLTGVDNNQVYVTIGGLADRTSNTNLYAAHKSTDNGFYVYIPTDLGLGEFNDTITIWASDKVANEGYMVSANIVYQTAKPMIYMECEEDYGQWTNKDVTFHSTVCDEVAGLQEVIYKVNGKVLKKQTFDSLTYSYSYDVVASEEADKSAGYAVTIEVVSNSGTAQKATRQVYIDKSTPSVQLSGVVDGEHYRSNQTIVAEVTDVSYKDTKTAYYITRTLDGKTTRFVTESFKSGRYRDGFNQKISKQGKYKIYAITTDGAGNMRKSNTVSFVIDKTAPVVGLSGISNNAMVSEPVTLTFTCVESFFATNTVSIEVEKTIDGQRVTRSLQDFPLHSKHEMIQETFSEDGAYRVTIAARDKAGNVAVSQTLDFSVDATKPEIRILGTDNYQMWAEPITVRCSIVESFYSSNNVKMTGTWKDIDGNVQEIHLPKMESSGKVSSIAQQFSEDGIYELEIMAKDAAGNQESKIIHFTIDKSIPEIRGLMAYDDRHYQSFQMTQVVKDMFKDLTVVSYRMLLNGMEYNGIDKVEKEGKYNLYVEVEDELGHKNIQNIEFIIDHTPPKVIFSGVRNGELVKDSGTIALSLTNADDIITGIRMNGVEYATDTKELSYSEYGSYRVEVDCEDKAGNTVTRELYFVYSNPLTVTVLAGTMGILLTGICMCLWICLRKKKGKCRSYDKSSCF